MTILTFFGNNDVMIFNPIANGIDNSIIHNALVDISPNTSVENSISSYIINIIQYISSFKFFIFLPFPTKFDCYDYIVFFCFLQCFLLTNFQFSYIIITILNIKFKEVLCKKIIL